MMAKYDHDARLDGTGLQRRGPGRGADDQLGSSTAARAAAEVADRTDGERQTEAP